MLKILLLTHTQAKLFNKIEQQKISKDFQKIVHEFQSIQRESATKTKIVVQQLHQLQEEKYCLFLILSDNEDVEAPLLQDTNKR